MFILLMSESSERVTLSTQVTPEVKQKFRVLAAQEGKSMSEYIRPILLDHLNDVKEVEGPDSS